AGGVLQAIIELILVQEPVDQPLPLGLVRVVGAVVQDLPHLVRGQATRGGDPLDVFVKGIASARGLAPDKVRKILDDGPYDAHEAERQGLIDGLLYKDELDDRLKDATR